MFVGGDGPCFNEVLVNAYQTNDVTTGYILNRLNVAPHHQDGPVCVRVCDQRINHSLSVVYVGLPTSLLLLLLLGFHTGFLAWGGGGGGSIDASTKRGNVRGYLSICTDFSIKIFENSWVRGNPSFPPPPSTTCYSQWKRPMECLLLIFHVNRRSDHPPYLWIVLMFKSSFFPGV